MNSTLLEGKKNFNIYGDKSVFLKPLSKFSYTNTIMLRQLNNDINVEYYSVTGATIDWTSSYYGLTGFPYVVLVLKEVYDNIIKGFCNFSVSTTAGTVTYLDNYLLNNTTFIELANLYENTDSLTATSVTGFLDKTINFIDYGKGICIFQYPVTSVENAIYSSGVQIIDNVFICELKANEFNNTSNPTCYEDSLTSTVSGFVTPYITTIGIYDDDNNLLMVSKLDRPIKKSNKIDMIFKLQMDT